MCPVLKLLHFIREKDIFDEMNKVVEKIRIEDGGAPGEPLPVSSEAAVSLREAKTRKEILDAVRLMVERFGFAKLTLDDIAGHLGKRKGFLYRYYQDKNSLLAAMVQREMGFFRSAVHEAVSRECSGASRLEAYLRVAFLELEKRMTLMVVLQQEVREKEHVGLFAVLDEARTIVLVDEPLLASFLREGGRDGSLRRMDEQEIRSVAQVVLSGVNGLLYYHILGMAVMPHREQFEIGYAMLLRGLSPEPSSPARVVASKGVLLEELQCGRFR